MNVNDNPIFATMITSKRPDPPFKKFGLNYAIMKLNPFRSDQGYIIYYTNTFSYLF